MTSTQRQGYVATELPVPTVAEAPAPVLLATGQATPSIEDPATVRRALAERGVVLIRGHQPVDDAGAARIADALFPDEPTFETGEHPRIGDNGALYRPVPFAADQTLLWHHENSFNATFPHVLIFLCRAPATSGGATTIVDSRLVYERMPDDIRALFAPGIRYSRSCDGHVGRRWQQLYATDDPIVAAQQAEDNGESLVIDGDTAHIVAERPAFMDTPFGPGWFNQVLHWHPAALPSDLRALVRRGAIPSFRDCRLANGDIIADDIVRDVMEAHTRHEYLVAWQPGDVLLIDNTVFAHGRRPYVGPREHYVRMVGRQHQPQPAKRAP